MYSVIIVISLRGAIGQRVRLLTERLVVQSHPGTIPFAFKCYDCQAMPLTDNQLESKQRLPTLVLDCFLLFLSDFGCLD